MSHVTHERVTSHIWRSHDADDADAQIHTWEVTSLCHVADAPNCKERYTWVLSHIQIRHAAHRIEPRRTYEWVTSHMWMSHVADAPSCQKRQQHDSFMCVTWLIHVCDVTHSCVTWMMRMCDVTHAYAWRDSRDSFICVTLLVYKCGTRFTLGGSHLNESCRRHTKVPSALWMSHVTHMNESRHTYEGVMSQTHKSICVTWLVYVMSQTHQVAKSASSIRSRLFQRLFQTCNEWRDSCAQRLVQRRTVVIYVCT